MIIKDKVVYVYDIEIFPNVFHAVVKNTETGIYHYLEISERRNDLSLIEWLFHNKDKDGRINSFLHNNKIFCGYNNKHYDDVIINYILDFYQVMKKLSYDKITASLFKLSNLIVSDNESNREKWKKWKYSNYFDSLDLLTMYFSSKLRIGLKEMQVTMQYKNVQEYDGDFTKNLPVEEIPKMIKYNKNDVDSTEALLNLSQKAIDLRLGIEKEYGINVLNSDGVSIGKEILKTKYLQDTGKSWDDIKDLRSPCNMVNLNEVILPSIEFETPVLRSLLSEMKELTVSPGINGWNKQFIFYNTIISIGVGGLHSVNEPEKIIPKEDECLVDVDAQSLYPSLLISYEFYPQHLGKEFLNTYCNIKKERVEAKHNGNKIKNETLKLALNSTTGLMQNEYSWMYSPKDVMKIRMNGQLLLLKLAEMLILKLGCRVIQYNTDGIFILLKKNQLEEYNVVIKEFESFSRLTMETEEFESMFQFAINDYIAVHKGFSETKNYDLVKQKGLFITKTNLGKGMDAKIIPIAIQNYFLEHIPVQKTIKECKDLNLFLTYQKVDKKFKVKLGDKQVARINRFYFSTNGNYLIKYDENREFKINAESGVEIVNNLENIKFPNNINYAYYIKQANKIISAIENRQLTLF